MCVCVLLAVLHCCCSPIAWIAGCKANGDTKKTNKKGSVVNGSALPPVDAVKKTDCLRNPWNGWKREQTEAGEEGRRQ